MALNAETIQQLTKPDECGIYTEYVCADCENIFNNNIHFHNFFELELVLKGCGHYEINNRVYEVRAGALFLTTPADYHTYSLRDGEEFYMLNLQFMPSKLSDEVESGLYTQTEPIALYFDGDEFDEIYASLKEINRTYARKESMYRIMLRNSVENLCISLLHRLEGQKDSANDYSAVKRAIIYIKNNYRGKLNLDTVSEYAGLSKSYFSRIFSSATGISLSAYIKRVRLEAAANLLKSTDLSVKEISYKTGFSSANYFTDAFCRGFGSSPRDYRRNYLAAQSQSSRQSDAPSQRNT